MQIRIGPMSPLWMRRALLALMAAVGLGMSAAGAQSAGKSEQSAAPALKQVLVAVHLRDPNLRITETKFRLFYEQVESKSVGVVDYDFGAALSEELVHVLTGDVRAHWRLPQGDELLFLRSYFEEKASQGTLPATVVADRILLVDVRRISRLGQGFFILSEFRMIERSSGQVLWKQRVARGYHDKDKERRKTESLMADNQKILKETLNRLIEEFCVEAREKVAKKPL